MRKLHFDLTNDSLVAAHGKDVTILRDKTKSKLSPVLVQVNSRCMPADWRIETELVDPKVAFVPKNFSYSSPYPVGIHVPRISNQLVVTYLEHGAM